VRKISYGEGVERVFPVYSRWWIRGRGAQGPRPPRQALYLRGRKAKAPASPNASSTKAPSKPKFAQRRAEDFLRPSGARRPGP